MTFEEEILGWPEHICHGLKVTRSVGELRDEVEVVTQLHFVLLHRYGRADVMLLCDDVVDVAYQPIVADEEKRVAGDATARRVWPQCRGGA